MNQTNGPFHIYSGGYGRAFFSPPNWRAAIVMWLRGWRPTHNYWWTKPNNKQRARVADLERNLDLAAASAKWSEDDYKVLQAKLAAAERDAARYRYMRDDGYGVTIDVLEYDDDGGEDWVSGHSPADLDAAIDRFMQPDNGGSEGL